MVPVHHLYKVVRDARGRRRPEVARAHLVFSSSTKLCTDRINSRICPKYHHRHQRRPRQSTHTTTVTPPAGPPARYQSPDARPPTCRGDDVVVEYRVVCLSRRCGCGGCTWGIYMINSISTQYSTRRWALAREYSNAMQEIIVTSSCC